MHSACLQPYFSDWVKRHLFIVSSPFAVSKLPSLATLRAVLAWHCHGNMHMKSRSEEGERRWKEGGRAFLLLQWTVAVGMETYQNKLLFWVIHSIRRCCVLLEAPVGLALGVWSEKAFPYMGADYGHIISRIFMKIFEILSTRFLTDCKLCQV